MSVVIERLVEVEIPAWLVVRAEAGSRRCEPIRWAAGATSEVRR